MRIDTARTIRYAFAGHRWRQFSFGGLMAQCTYVCDPKVWAVPSHPCSRETTEGEVLCALHHQADWKDKSPQSYTDEDKQQRAVFEKTIEQILVEPQSVADRDGESRSIADFSGIIFPHDFHLLKGRKLEVAVSFATAQFRYEVSFHNTRFREHAVFAEAVFPGTADFAGARFSAEADFNGATFAMGLFDGARFAGTSFEQAGFNLDASFLRVRFEKPASFYETVFSGTATFDGSVFEHTAGFRDATFGEQVSFQSVRFDRLVDFPERRPVGMMFRRSVRRPGGDEEDAEPLPTGFLHLFHLYGAVFGDADSGEEAYRKAKLIFRSRGDYFRAGYCYRMERHYTNKRLPLLSRRFPWLGTTKILDRITGGWLCGWGEQPWKVAVGALIVIVSFGLIFSAPGAIEKTIRPQSPSELVANQLWWPDRLQIAIYFSGVTFTSLGYGDYHPANGYGIFGIVEALIGLALISLFVVCVARKLMH